MTSPKAHLAMAAAAHGHLLEALGALGDDEAAGPSLLPGWTRAEVVTHLARNADSHRRMCEAALRGEVADQYEGGRKGRAADIAAGRGRPAAELVADLARSIEWLHETWWAMDDDAWQGTLGYLGGARPAHTSPFRRTFEVEVHHVDLDLGYRPDSWPVLFVEEGIQHAVTSLPGRAGSDPAEMDEGAWVLWAEDLELAWVIDIAPEGVEVLPLGDDQPDGMVRGPAAWILWWLLGREPAAAAKNLSTVGALADLPALFPYR